ncbi:ABC transporter permease [Paenibacillus xylanexedens]|uniref:ABC transporter permease n=1 Tax=Paenibacillus xylanexedens TaxID=528191 RepID=UPI001642D367|nr:ABC transporter permease subunit [Paenibacillus xylanexedens]
MLATKYKLFFLVLPFMIFVFVFAYMPLWGWLYAFVDYRPGRSIFQMDFVGLKWFKMMVYSKQQFYEVLRVLKNTFGMSFLSLIASILPMAFAILLYEIRSTKMRKIVQTLTTIPHFISWVLVYSIVFALLSVDSGVVNNILLNTGFISKPINFLASSDHIWIKMIALEIWKGLGWSSILYLAAINGIPQDLYEAAKIDGAGRFHSVWHITVPGLLPTFFVLLMLAVANMINTGMDQFFVFANAMTKSSIEVLDLYTYNIGLLKGNFSLATVISILKTLVSLVLLFSVNRLSKTLRGESIF